MKNRKKNDLNKKQKIPRKEAIKKIDAYFKYAVLTALGTYLILTPRKAQAQSFPEDLGTDF